MALTREYRKTVVERLRDDREFTAALFSEAIAAFIEGDKQTALSMLRDLVHAHISFKTLSEQTGFDEKGLHRMLSSRGNPTTQNLSTLLHTIEKDLDLRVEVKALYRSCPCPTALRGSPESCGCSESIPIRSL